MSPEQARSEGHRVDGRSDIYSLGVVFYELLTGTRPFKASNQDDLLDCIRNVEVRPLRQLNSSIPRELERICLKALAKKISDRYSTASDLANDLRTWNTSPDVHSALTLGTVPMLPDEHLESKSLRSLRSLDIGNIAVVPHGLRPFDSGDADFFNYLLPGARDRYGVPDCVSFWTSRILNRNPAETFRVGVLLGRSGSGKSSMMRAGVLPQVKGDVHAVYVEAKPELLEANLLAQLRHTLPSKQFGKSLRETLTLFRQSSKEQAGKKLVIVIDQFEQWLNHHRDDATTELHEALRQCDGEHLQAILLVRDDFLAGLTHFMDQIEEYLLQNQNFATVEPFGQLHAKRVLCAFGRAYGVLNERLGFEQQAFLDEAVEQLADAGRMAPVQLAVLSEMIKDKPWNVATLQSLGGVEGLGVAFLEERLAGLNAHPLLRAELPVVRRILTEMLPVDDTVIKPPACSQSALLDRLSGIASDDLIRRLLNLLDTEVRLITPTSSASASLPNSGTGSTLGSSISDPAYQLTHDYLVPTTRKWLESLDSGTRGGRVRQQLREMAVAWNAKPTAKRLPSLAEWSAIRWFVNPIEWTNQERRMMRAAEKRLRQLAIVICAVVASLGGVGYLTMQEIQSQSLVDRLLEGDTGNVASILQAVEPYRAKVLSRLQQIDLDAGEAETAARRRLHFALASFDSDANHAEYVLNELHNVEDRHLSSLISYLMQRQSLDTDQLLTKVRTAIQQHSPTALPLSALLAARQPQHEIWTEIANDIVPFLVGKRSTQLHHWPELLMPVRQQLLPALVKAIELSSKAGEAKLENHFYLLSAFAEGDEASLARAVAFCPPELLVSLLDEQSLSVQLSIELRKQLSIAKGIDQLNMDEVISKVIRGFDGQVTANCAWASQVPWDELRQVLSMMREAGYAPNSIRPYQLGKEIFVALTWQKNAVDFLVETALTKDALRSRFNEQRDRGAVMLDLANYTVPNAPDAEGIQWAAIWHNPGESAESQSQLLTFGDEEAETAGYTQIRICTELDGKGDCEHAILWNRFEDTATLKSLSTTRVQRAFGDLYPAFCYMDLRYQPIAPTKARGPNWLDYHHYLDGMSNADKPTAREQVVLCTYLSACGSTEESLSRLLKLSESDFAKLPTSMRASTTRGWQRQLARAYARLGKADELQKLLDETINIGEFHQGEKDYLYLRLALLKQDQAKVEQLLGNLEKVADESNNLDDYYLRSLALVATAQNDLSDTAFQKLIARAPQSIAKNEDLQAVFLDVDFDGVCGREPWRQLLDLLGLSQLVTVSCDNRSDEESQMILASPVLDHSQLALKLSEQGWLPTCLNSHSSDTEGRLVSSIWKRAKRTTAELASEARRIAMLSLALAHIGEMDELRYGLEEKLGRGVQTALIVHAPSVLPSERVVALLREASTEQLQSALVSILGGYRFVQLSEENRQYLTQRLQEWAAKASNAALLSNAQWCLRQWNQETSRRISQPSFSANATWFTTTLGQPMVIVKPPPHVLVGKDDERRVWVRIDRNYAVAAHEVTGAEYAEFLQDPRVAAWIDRDRRARNAKLADDRLPQAASWQHAVRYCQWLSEREHVPESQWCYAHVWEDDQEVALEPGYLDRSGYRLPTLAEREWACAAGSEDAWHFGNDPTLISRFEWTLPHSEGAVHEIATMRPNNFGLFDMGGNLSEWVDNVVSFPLRSRLQYFFVDSGNKSKAAGEDRFLAGGRFKFGEQAACSNYCVHELPNYLSSSTGFRVARTIPK